MFLPRPRLKMPDVAERAEPPPVRIPRPSPGPRPRPARPRARGRACEPAHRGRKPEQMMRDDAQRPIVQRPLELIVVEVERRGVDVAEDRPQSRLEHGRRDGEAGIRGDDDVVPRTPFRRRRAFSAIKREGQRRRSGRHEKAWRRRSPPGSDPRSPESHGPAEHSRARPCHRSAHVIGAAAGGSVRPILMDNQ